MDCSAQSLATNATTIFCCIRGRQEINAARIWLLATIAGVSTDPATLRENAKCLDGCVPPGMLLAIRTYLMTLIAGSSTDPSALANDARCFRANCFPVGMRAAAQLFILASIAGVSNDATFLLEQSKQIRCCIPEGSYLAIEVSLLCVIAGV